MTIVPRFGEFTSAVKALIPHFDRTETISIAGGILALLGDGKYFVAAIILTFSVLFPLWKLGVIWHSLNAVEAGGRLDRQLHVIEKLGKFSMVDIFVIALLVLAVKGLPGGSAVTLHWGVIAFAASALISMNLPALLEKLVAERELRSKECRASHDTKNEI
jgi:paraquat-inducible protein A